ncbi:hypothetical protein REC12_17350 [Desulfosporosinus sp. PR]|uniref:hypothetical protein n=1 Tax=Candidatus Desulfosporosinus nitrosoreducens TaxID=3401928 RepID=UPI0027EE91B9|nr:hypothetical protein [Desulfosporosinus sp. PR]MDQ7095359.1 hypothetical protein [Desulfosporosinus sp. PR]
MKKAYANKRKQDFSPEVLRGKGGIRCLKGLGAVRGDPEMLLGGDFKLCNGLALYCRCGGCQGHRYGGLLPENSKGD